MSQNPPWPGQGQGAPGDPQGGRGGGPQQGGYPPPGQPQPGGGYPPHGQPPQGQPPQGGGYPPHGGYPQQGAGYPPPGGGYGGQQGGYQGGYPPQGGPGGYPPAGGYQPQNATYSGPFQGQPPGGHPGQGGSGYQPPPGPGGPPPGSGGGSPRKSTGLIIGIVVAAVVLLVAVGGIIMALGGGEDEPVSTITPSAPSTPTAEPTTEPTDEPTDEPSSAPSNTSQPTDQPTTAPGGDSIDLGNGVKLTPASDWQVKSQKTGAAQLSNGRDVFVGIVANLPKGSNPSQTCDAYHRDIAKEYTNGKFAEPKAADLGTKKLSGATCVAQVTVANGGNAIPVVIFSLVSIRTDGLTVVGSLYFTEDSDTTQLDKDFGTMVNSMLKGQAAGG